MRRTVFTKKDVTEKENKYCVYVKKNTRYFRKSSNTEWFLFLRA